MEEAASASPRKRSRSAGRRPLNGAGKRSGVHPAIFVLVFRFPPRTLRLHFRPVHIPAETGGEKVKIFSFPGLTLLKPGIFAPKTYQTTWPNPPQLSTGASFASAKITIG